MQELPASHQETDMPAMISKDKKDYTFQWVDLDSEIYSARAKIQGGWLVSMHVKVGVGICFVPDPKHTWDGTTLPDTTSK